MAISPTTLVITTGNNQWIVSTISNQWKADDIADGEEKTVREFEEPQVQSESQTDQLENQNEPPANSGTPSAISNPVGSGKKWASGEMVTDSKEVFFEQVQLAPAVRDKVNSMIDSGLFFGNFYGAFMTSFVR